jgi:hypothetical protein
LILLVVP